MGKSSRPAPGSNRQAKIEAAAKATKPGPNKAVIAAVVAIVAIVGIVTAVVLQSKSQSDAVSQGGKAVPAGTSMGQGYWAYPNATLVSGAPTLDIYEDFQCPICGQAESVVGEQIAQLGSSGKAKVIFHVKDFLDAKLGNDSSLRAGIGAFCAADAGKFAEFHKIVFANQPAQEGDGYSDATLRGFAEQAGITGAALTTWDSCVKAKKYEGYITSVEDQSSRDGVNGTPTFRLNGTDLTDAELKSIYTTADGLTKLVTAATK